MREASVGQDDMMTAQFGDQLPDISTDGGPAENEARSTPGLPSALLRIPVSVQVVIGTARLPLSQLTQLAPGATLTLDEKLGTPARMLVNGREVARGELFVLEGAEGRLGLTIKEVASTESDS